MKAEIKSISPAAAAELLERNIGNRIVRRDHLRALTSAMANGTWTLNGETIKIGTDNRILDGQHRLMACVVAGVPFRSWVVYDVPPDAVLTMNGGKPWNVSDFHSFHGERNAKKLAAAINVICGLGRCHDTSIPFEEQELFLEKNPLLRGVVTTRLIKGARGVSPAIEHACRYVIGFHFGMEVSGDWMVNFSLANYDEAQRKLAVYLARRRAGDRHTDPSVVCAYICMAAKISITGRLKVLNWNWKDDAFPLPLEEIYL